MVSPDPSFSVEEFPGTTLGQIIAREEKRSKKKFAATGRG